uniref:Mannitol dehydrogenase putative n=1 Tax=Albugo laibachii Nc14 TaxID=890382 RepID=F0WLH2_9STRA|nr:mannitol dehydrogenase putative [Albugo laibachii Nc14]|eukprot:CCA22135.1 mannitol dehydrogenase putative [Albugo laibachii Nc14]
MTCDTDEFEDKPKFSFGYIMADIRKVNAFACFEPKGTLQPWTYESRPLGPDDVEIKITHCGICGSDIHTMDSGWGPTKYPCVVGHEIVGEITKIGSNEKWHKIGDRVGVGAEVLTCVGKPKRLNCRDCKEGYDSYCQNKVFTYNSTYADGAQAYGGYADYVRVSGHYAFRIPKNIPSDQAAPLLCAGVTVYSPLSRHGVQRGDRVGVVGIGGLGHLAIQFIKAMNGVAVAFSHSPSKREEAAKLGADDFVDLSGEIADDVFGSIKLLLVTANAKNLAYDLFLQLLCTRGTLVMLGLPEEKIKLSGGSLIQKGIKLVGSLVGSCEEIEAMLQLASEKNVCPLIEKYPMSKVNDGIERVRSGKVRYRVVLEN